MAELSESKTLEFISEDSFLSCFLNDTYRQITLAGTGQDQQPPLTNDQVAKLNSAISALTQDIYAIVTDNYPNLIEQSQKLDTLGTTMSRFQERLNGLIESVDKLRQKLNDPYNRISRRMVLLRRLKTTSDLLRKVVRLVQLSKRIQQLNLLDENKTPSKRDIGKCGQIVTEFETVLDSDRDQLVAIDILKSEIEFVSEMKRSIVALASVDSQDNTTKNTLQQH